MTFSVLLLFFHAKEELFRTGSSLKSLITQILMIYAGKPLVISFSE